MLWSLSSEKLNRGRKIKKNCFRIARWLVFTTSLWKFKRIFFFCVCVYLKGGGWQGLFLQNPHNCWLFYSWSWWFYQILYFHCSDRPLGWIQMTTLGIWTVRVVLWSCDLCEFVWGMCSAPGFVCAVKPSHNILPSLIGRESCTALGQVIAYLFAWKTGCSWKGLGFCFGAGIPAVWDYFRNFSSEFYQSCGWTNICACSLRPVAGSWFCCYFLWVQGEGVSWCFRKTLFGCTTSQPCYLWTTGVPYTLHTAGHRISGSCSGSWAWEAVYCCLSRYFPYSTWLIQNFAFLFSTNFPWVCECRSLVF